MSTIYNAAEIIKRAVLVLGLKDETALADTLKITKQVLSTWKSRNSKRLEEEISKIIPAGRLEWVLYGHVEEGPKSAEGKRVGLLLDKMPEYKRIMWLARVLKEEAEGTD